MSLVITFAFQAYRGIADAYTRVSEVTSRDRSARILLDRIERELTGAVMVQREEGADPLTHPYFFFAEPRASEESSGFELRFITQTPLRSPGSPPAALALVTYGVVPSQTGPGFTLLRQEEPVPALLAKQVEWTTPADHGRQRLDLLARLRRRSGRRRRRAGTRRAWSSSTSCRTRSRS